MEHSGYRQGSVFFALEVAGASPSRAEISGAMELQEAEFLGGWEMRNRRTDVSDGSSRFPKSILGMQARVGDPMMTHSGDKLVEGTQGFLLVLPGGDVARRVLQMWPV